MRRYVLAGLILALASGASASSLWAVEASINSAPTHWRYQESSGIRPGYASTPFASSAGGWGLRLDASLQRPWDDHADWSVRVDMSGMLPINKADETWLLAGGSSAQRNELDIRQVEGRAAVFRRIRAWQAGVWGAYQWQQQRRRRFVVNGNPVVVAGEPVRENISSAWLGGELDARFGRVGIRIAGGLPVWVRVSNSTLPGKAFDRRAGYRWDVTAAWQALEGKTMDVDLRVDYRYRKMGGDSKPFGLWPDNRYQEFSGGIALRW